MQWYTNYITQYFQAGLQSGLVIIGGSFVLQIRRLSIFSCQPSVHWFFPGRLHSHTCVCGGRSWLRGIVILLRCLLQPFCAIEKYAIVQNEIVQCDIVRYVNVQCSIVQSASVQFVNVQCVFVQCVIMECALYNRAIVEFALCNCAIVECTLYNCAMRIHFQPLPVN